VLARANNDVLPHEAALKARDDEPLEEERRVAYVAFSRAQDAMVVTYADVDEDRRRLEPSCFLDALPARVRHKVHVEDAADYAADVPPRPAKAPRLAS